MDWGRRAEPACPVKWPGEELVNREMKGKVKGETERECERSCGVTKMCQPAKSVFSWPVWLVNTGGEDEGWSALLQWLVPLSGTKDSLDFPLAPAPLSYVLCTATGMVFSKCKYDLIPLCLKPINHVPCLHDLLLPLGPDSPCTTGWAPAILAFSPFRALSQSLVNTSSYSVF